jgi:thiamine-monophosphate kinase
MSKKPSKNRGRSPISQTVSTLGEFGLIERLKKIVPASKDVILSIGDDTAVLPLSKEKYQLLTTDMMVENVHFTKAMNPFAIGHKALACNISDIASMGGYPTVAVVSLGVPKNCPVSFIENIYKGMAKLAKQFDVSIVGGDTVKSEAIVINVALLGEVKKKHLVTRSGAKPGDWIFVTGPLGGSFQSGRHLTFTPRVKEAEFLVRQVGPSAMMDISDGLAGDLNHILKASGVGAQLLEDAIPKNIGASLQQALTDGEDYELLFTAPKKGAHKLMGRFFSIGVITHNKKQTINAKSFTHF